MQFEFATANRIIFGRSSLSAVPDLLANKCESVLVVTGSSSDRFGLPLAKGIQEKGIRTSLLEIPDEPTIEMLSEKLEYSREKSVERIVAIGGGSTIDAAKALAGLIPNEGEILDFLEVIGKGRPLEKAPLSSIAIPTTAGTGSEVTRNAVLKSSREKVKVSLRDRRLLPETAVIDPELTLSCPPKATAGSGLDALTQVIEPYLSSLANPLTDSLCEEGIMRAARSLRRAYLNPRDLEAREDLCVTSLFGGLGLANSGLGVVHGLAGPLGGMLDAPHGMICARILPYALEVNWRKINSSELEKRFHRVAQLLTGNVEAEISQGIEWIKTSCQILEVPGLSSFGLHQGQLEEVAEKAQRASSMRGNPTRLRSEAIIEILEQAL